MRLDHISLTEYWVAAKIELRQGGSWWQSSDSKILHMKWQVEVKLAGCSIEIACASSRSKFLIQTTIWSGSVDLMQQKWGWEEKLHYHCLGLRMKDAAACCPGWRWAAWSPCSGRRAPAGTCVSWSPWGWPSTDAATSARAGSCRWAGTTNCCRRPPPQWAACWTLKHLLQQRRPWCCCCTGPLHSQTASNPCLSLF